MNFLPQAVKKKLVSACPSSTSTATQSNYSELAESCAHDARHADLARDRDRAPRSHPAKFSRSTACLNWCLVASRRCTALGGAPCGRSCIGAPNRGGRGRRLSQVSALLFPTVNTVSRSGEAGVVGGCDCAGKACKTLPPLAFTSSDRHLVSSHQ